MRYGLGSGPTTRVRFDLTFSSRQPVWDLHETHPSGGKVDPLFPGGHAEQLGQVDGEVAIGDETFTLRAAPTCRDHSRGVRNWSSHHSHLWLNAEFSSGWGFCSFVSFAADSIEPALNAAALFRGGRTVPATIETDGRLMVGDDIWRPFTITLKPQGLEPVQIEVSKLWNGWPFGVYDLGDLYWGVPTGPPEPRAFWTTEQSGVFHVGSDTGAGRVERCNRDIVVDDRWRAMCTPERFGG